MGGTLAVCRQLGIQFMGTGGIGGVHRGFAESLDISGDLLQIARTRAVVVASGPKSLLDVGATSELLETLAVPVLGWQTGTLPRFYTAAGGPPVSARSQRLPGSRPDLRRALGPRRCGRPAAGPPARRRDRHRPADR